MQVLKSVNDVDANVGAGVAADKLADTVADITDDFMLENMAAKLPGGFFIYRADDNQDILYANDVLLDIFGCSSLDEFKKLTGYTFKGLVHPDDLANVERSIVKQIAESDKNLDCGVKSDKKLDYVEFRITRKDGAVRWVDDYGRFVHTKNHGDLYYVFIRDITNQRTWQEENVRREKVIEGLSIGFSSIYLLNLDTGTIRPYRLQNNFFQNIVDELKTSSTSEPDFRKILPIYANRHIFADDRALFLKETSVDNILERLKSENSYSFHYRCANSNGEIVHMETSIIKTKDEELQHHVIMSFRDVTEQITKVQNELAEKLNIETALEREKHANEIKASFLFSISHDIRTPMNAIMGFTALSKRHLNEPELLQNYLDKLDESNHHMLALIDDLLEMSKIDYGKIELKTEPCELAEQLEIVLDMFRVQASDKGVYLEEDVDLPNQQVCLDALRFRRVMSNILSNAVKFTSPNGKVTITARQKRVSNSGYARYQFSVSDTGVGMSQDFLHKIFNAFERESTSTQTGFVGTGLGLAITKKLLDIMGGSISVKSVKGQGSTFTVDLPLKLSNNSDIQAADNSDLKSADNSKVQATNQAEVVAESSFKATTKHRILLVEDIEVNRMLAETILTESGFLVESVPDGCDAVELIKNQPPNYFDLVLMDIQMPVMNGYEATRSIRALGREDTNTLPIIALSANAREQDKLMSLQSGMNSHVAKPFDIANLIATVNEHIAKNVP